MVDVKRIKKIDDIPADVWNNLLKKSETDTVFLTREWIRCWWDCMGMGHELLLLGAYDSSTLVGIAPLMLTRKKSGFTSTSIIEFIGTGEIDFCDFICVTDKKTGIVPGFMDYLSSIKNKWHEISFENIPDRSSTSTIINDWLKRSQFKALERPPKECFSMLVKDNEEFAQEKLKRKGVKTRFNFLNSHGNLEYRKAQTPDEILNELDKFFEFHSDRRLLSGDKSKFHEKEAREFYKCLIKNLFPKGMLRFDMLKFNGEPIAYHFGYNYNNRHIHYTPVFNVDYYRRSPGMVMMKCLIEDCLENHLDELDFTKGDEIYKTWFSNSQSKNLRINIFRDDARYLIALRQKELMGVVKKKKPEIYYKIKKLLTPSTYTLAIKAAFHMIKRRGIKSVLAKLWIGFLTSIYLSLKIIIFRMVLSERDLNWVQGDFVIREGKFADLKEIVKDSSELRQRQLLQSWFERIKNGHKVYIVEKDNRIVHYSWSGLTQDVYLMEMDYTYKLPREMWYLYHSYTYPNYRGLGIYTSMLRYVADRAAEAGCNELCGYVLSRNFVPQKGIKSTGALPFAGVAMTKILGFKKFRTFLYENKFTEILK